MIDQISTVQQEEEPSVEKPIINNPSIFDSSVTDNLTQKIAKLEQYSQQSIRSRNINQKRRQKDSSASEGSRRPICEKENCLELVKQTSTNQGHTQPTRPRQTNQEIELQRTRKSQSTSITSNRLQNKTLRILPFLDQLKQQPSQSIETFLPLIGSSPSKLTPNPKGQEEENSASQRINPAENQQDQLKTDISGLKQAIEVVKNALEIPEKDNLLLQETTQEINQNLVNQQFDVDSRSHRTCDQVKISKEVEKDTSSSSSSLTQNFNCNQIQLEKIPASHTNSLEPTPVNEQIQACTIAVDSQCFSGTKQPSISDQTEQSTMQVEELNNDATNLMSKRFCSKEIEGFKSNSILENERLQSLFKSYLLDYPVEELFAYLDDFVNLETSINQFVGFIESDLPEQEISLDATTPLSLDEIIDSIPEPNLEDNSANEEAHLKNLLTKIIVDLNEMFNHETTLDESRAQIGKSETHLKNWEEWVERQSKIPSLIIEKKPELNFGFVFPGKIVESSFEIKNDKCYANLTTINVSCLNPEFDEHGEYVFSVRLNSLQEYNDNLVVSIPKYSTMRFHVALKAPNITEKKHIKGILRITSQDKDFELSTPIECTVEIPRILCTRELFNSAYASKVIRIAIKRSKKCECKIPFKNTNNQFISLEPFWVEEAPIVVQTNNSNSSETIKSPFNVIFYTEYLYSIPAKGIFFIHLIVRPNAYFKEFNDQRLQNGDNSPIELKNVLVFRIRDSIVLPHFPISIEVY